MFKKDEIQTIYNALSYYSKKEELKYNKEVSDNVTYLIGKVLEILEEESYE